MERQRDQTSSKYLEGRSKCKIRTDLLTFRACWSYLQRGWVVGKLPYFVRERDRLGEILLCSKTRR